MSNWLSFITSLPTETAILRQRTCRTLKASGAAVLRDGVYLMLEREGCGTAGELCIGTKCAHAPGIDGALP